MFQNEDNFRQAKLLLIDEINSLQLINTKNWEAAIENFLDVGDHKIYGCGISFDK